MSTAQHQLILPLQPFLSLASTLTGPVSTSNFILQIINHPHIFVFGEVLNIPQVKQLSDEDVNKKLLKLFAYGNYWDYKGMNLFKCIIFYSNIQYYNFDMILYNGNNC